jgi:hypothetical protein
VDVGVYRHARRFDDPFVDTNETAVDAVVLASFRPMHGGVWATAETARTNANNEDFVKLMGTSAARHTELRKRRLRVESFTPSADSRLGSTSGGQPWMVGRTSVVRAILSRR